MVGFGNNIVETTGNNKLSLKDNLREGAHELSSSPVSSSAEQALRVMHENDNNISSNKKTTMQESDNCKTSQLETAAAKACTSSNGGDCTSATSISPEIFDTAAEIDRLYNLGVASKMDFWLIDFGLAVGAKQWAGNDFGGVNSGGVNNGGVNNRESFVTANFMTPTHHGTSSTGMRHSEGWHSTRRGAATTSHHAGRGSHTHRSAGGGPGPFASAVAQQQVTDLSDKEGSKNREDTNLLDKEDSILNGTPNHGHSNSSGNPNTMVATAGAQNTATLMGGGQGPLQSLNSSSFSQQKPLWRTHDIAGDCKYWPSASWKQFLHGWKYLAQAQSETQL